MNIEQKDISPTRKAILAHYTADEVSAEEDLVLAEFIQFAKIPGFRPGKASPAMVRKQYSKEMSKELNQRLVQKAHEQGLGKSDLRIYSIVELEPGKIVSGEKATISFSVDIIPNFELPEYEGVKVKSAPTEADDKEIDQMIGYILGQRAEFKPVDKVIEKGNYVQCAYTGKIGDTLIEEIAPNEAMYGTQKSTWEEAGAENAPGVPAIVEGLIGMQKDETKEVEMDFPSDFKIETLAGKKATYEIKVTDIREKILPEMDEAFFESMQVKDEEAFREQIKGTIEQRKENEIANGNRQQIVDHLIQFVTVPLPESGIESERESILRDFMQKNMQQGVSAEDFEKNKEALHESASKMAESRLKSFIILDMIADKESIKVENEDLNRAIIQQASMSGQKPEALVKELKKDRSKIDAMQRDIKIGKTLNFLMEKAEISIDTKSDSKD